MTGIWVSVDGVEGVGKTTLVNAIRHRRSDVVTVAEFSEGPLGRMLARAVAESPHDICRSPLGQSLVFLGEFRERYDETVRPAIESGELVVHDRGYLSKYAYQHAVMEPTMGADAGVLLDSLFGFFPPPDLCVLLTAPTATIRSRLIERDGSCDNERLEFITRADVTLRAGVPAADRTMMFDTSTMNPNEIAERVLAEVSTI